MAVGFNLPDPYEAQKADIARRQKYAEILQQQAFQPVEQFSYQGIPAPVPIAATLAKILQGAGGAYLMKKSEDEARELREGDIKKGQEFAAALGGAKTPEDRQALAMRAMGGEFGQRAQIIGGGEYQMAETRAEKERQREARRQEVEDRLRAQREAAADRLASQQAIAGMAAGMRADIEAGRREDREREFNRRLAEDARKRAELTQPEQHQLYKVMEQAEAGQSSVSALREARAYSDKFQGGSAGVGASWLERQAAAIAGVSPSESAQATAMYNNIMGTEMLGKLRATFGGNPTNAEREVLTKLQASASEPQSVRNALLDRAIRLAEERQKRAEAEADAIRTRSYRQPGGAPAAPAPAAGASAAPGAPAAPAAPAAAPGAPVAPGAAPRRVVVDY